MGLRSCGSSEAVKRRWRACVSRLQLSAAALAKIISLMATSCGKQRSSACRQGGLQSPPAAATDPRFSSCSFTTTQRDRDGLTTPPRKDFPVQRGICSCLGFSRILRCSDKQPGRASGGETSLFSQLQPESTQPVETGQGPARYSL